MNVMETYNSVAESVITALINSVWQSLILILLATLVLKLFNRTTASTRYLVWWGVLIATIGLIFTPRTAEEIAISGLPPSIPNASTELNTVSPVSRVDLAGANGTERVPVDSTSISDLKIVPSWLASAFFGLMVLLCLCHLLRISRAVQHLRRLKSKGQPSDSLQRLVRCIPAGRFNRQITVCTSSDVSTPLLAGLIKPQVFVPSDLVEQLETEELKSLLVHEVAHVRRLDDWTNLIQKLIEAVFFFHLSVRWICRKLNLEREVACDDWVVAVLEKPLDYASCLARLTRLTSPVKAAPPLVQAALVGKKQISRRIEMLVRRNSSSKRMSVLSLCLSTIVLAIGFVILRAAPVIAIAEPYQQQEIEPPVVQPVSVALADLTSPGDPVLVPTGLQERGTQKIEPSQEKLREEAEKFLREQIEPREREIERRRQELEKIQQEAETVRRHLMEAHEKDLARLDRELIEPKRIELERMARELIEPKQRELELMSKEQVRSAERTLEAELAKNQGKVTADVERLRNELEAKLRQELGSRQRETERSMRDQLQAMAKLREQLERDLRTQLEPKRMELEKATMERLEPLRREFDKKLREELEPLKKELEELRRHIERLNRQN